MGNLKPLLGVCVGAFPIQGDEGDCSMELYYDFPDINQAPIM